MFNINTEKAIEIRKKDVYCLIIYDITSNKRRLKLSNLLEGYGVRVQRSCFEVKTTRTHFNQLLNELHSFYDSDELDNVIVYHIADGKIYRYNEELIQFDDNLILL